MENRKPQQFNTLEQLEKQLNDVKDEISDRIEEMNNITMQRDYPEIKIIDEKAEVRKQNADRIEELNKKQLEIENQIRNLRQK
ncbi:MAG TPA: hypothetical protein VFQ59_02345 [Candidatus Paceibacterota bacterium]|nr:hypothetical protein [Candidatus Paceibacterota bacterium]